MCDLDRVLCAHKSARSAAKIAVRLAPSHSLLSTTHASPTSAHPPPSSPKHHSHPPAAAAPAHTTAATTQTTPLATALRCVVPTACLLALASVVSLVCPVLLRLKLRTSVVARSGSVLACEGRVGFRRRFLYSIFEVSRRFVVFVLGGGLATGCSLG